MRNKKGRVGCPGTAYSGSASWWKGSEEMIQKILNSNFQGETREQYSIPRWKTDISRPRKRWKTSTWNITLRTRRAGDVGRASGNHLAQDVGSQTFSFGCCFQNTCYLSCNERDASRVLECLHLLGTL